MKHIKTIITALALALAVTGMAQADQHKGEVAPPATGAVVHGADHSHDVQAPRATGTVEYGVDQSHHAATQHSTAPIATAPAAKPSGSAHPYHAPAGKEATSHKAPAARPAHNGPTAVRQPQGAEAAHHKAAAVRPPHTGPTPANTSAAKAGRDHAQKTNTNK